VRGEKHLVYFDKCDFGISGGPDHPDDTLWCESEAALLVMRSIPDYQGRIAAHGPQVFSETPPGWLLKTEKLLEDVRKEENRQRRQPNKNGRESKK
jgi:hypothetical protein